MALQAVLHLRFGQTKEKEKSDEGSVKTVRRITSRGYDAMYRWNSLNTQKPRTVLDTSDTNIEPQPKQSNKHFKNGARRVSAQ